MAAIVVKSTEVTNMEAKPQVFNRPEQMAGRVRTIQGTRACVAGDWLDVGDQLIIARVPADAVIRRLEVASDVLDSDVSPTLSMNIGIYDLDGNAKDADVYATLDLTFEAGFAFKDLAFEARDHKLINQRVFEDAGDTEASHDREYYICITAAAVSVGDDAGDISWRIDYVID